MNEFLDSITEMESPQLNISIDELILEGESQHLEFKSSLRWDYRELRVNKSLEEVVLKTICDFEQEKLNDVKNKFPDSEIYTDDRSIFEDNDIDIVSISSYDNYHSKQIVKAFENGKHVMT